MKKALPNLKRVMLVSSLENGRQIYAAPGHIEFDDKPYSSHGVDNFTHDRDMMGFVLSREVARHFLKRTSDAEVIPDIRCVQAKRITKVPGEDWDYTIGEPYASILKTP